MSTNFENFIQEIEEEAQSEGKAAVEQLFAFRNYFEQLRIDTIGEKMSSATYAFVFSGSDDWRVSSPDEWDLEVVELQGNEKTLGHKKIDGSICKILQTSDGQLVAITK